jgi:peptidoglycan LD-endopeptidase LytH
LSRLALIGTNSLTAVITAAITSIFWIGTYQTARQGPEFASSSNRPSNHAEPARVASGEQRALIRGPTGIAIPVVGVKPNQLVDTYTQSRGGGSRVHDAIDIMAPEGTPVVAAAPGRLEKLFFSNGGGGITAYVRSDDGHWNFYYAHLRNYAPGLHEGQMVRQGDPIGNVGHTGNASPDGPHLHFAIFRMGPGEKWYQGTAINPYPLLAGNKTSR